MQQKNTYTTNLNYLFTLKNSEGLFTNFNFLIFVTFLELYINIIILLKKSLKIYKI